jgi:hypothetical protein
MAVLHVRSSITMPITFPSAQSIEWLSFDVVERILQVPRADILALVESGILSARGERISSASLDQYSATKPLFGRPAPPTYEKTRHGVRLVIE